MIPNHIAFIVDGNRRYAKKNLLAAVTQGHEIGSDKLKQVLNWCIHLGVKEITVYSFSMQNFQRSKIEVDTLMNIIAKGVREIGDDPDIHEYKVRVHAAGRIAILPKKVREAITYAEDRTKDYSDRQINLCLAYGGREEITDAVKQIAKKIQSNELKPEDITENTIQEELYVKSDPDLIVRTSGETRLSNFLPWQSTYSEILFIEKLWPELEKKDIVKIIDDFSKKERRFGK